MQFLGSFPKYEGKFCSFLPLNCIQSVYTCRLKKIKGLLPYKLIEVLILGKVDQLVPDLHIRTTNQA
jgi:hypothetical protein